MVNPISNSEEFHFSRIDIHCMMSYFGNDFLLLMSIRDYSGYIVFNTHIYYNKYHILFDERVLVDVI